MAQLRAGFAQLITTLLADGYFDRALPKICVDDHDGIEFDPGAVLAERLGAPDLWPLTPSPATPTFETPRSRPHRDRRTRPPHQTAGHRTADPHPRRPTRTGRPTHAPQLFDVLDACPTTRTWKTRASEPHLAGLRDRALLLVGFFAALRRAELAALTVEQISTHDRGLVLALPRSKTNQHGDRAELVVLPRTGRRTHCPVTTLQAWLEHASITDGPVLRKISRGNRALPHPLHPESVNDLVQAAVSRAGLQGGSYSAHSLRAGFVTYAHLRGASDRAIAHQTRHRSLATLGMYVRIHEAWEDNAATMLGL